MKKIQRINLDQISREFTPLSKDAEREIKGGANISNNCVAQAIGLASVELGCSVNMNIVNDAAVAIIMRDNGMDLNGSTALARGMYAMNGLTETQARELLNRVFTDIAEGSCGSGSTSIAFIKIGGNVAHAVLKKTIKGVTVYTDGRNVFLPDDSDFIMPPTSVSYISNGYYYQ